MEHQVTNSIEFIMKSQYELARILEAERDVISHLSRVMSAIPNKPVSFGQGASAVELSLEATQDIATYLSSLGDLEEAIADNLEIVMSELHVGEAHE